VIIPALNEEKAIGLVLCDIPGTIVDQVIAVDNGSTDGTTREAARHGAIVIREPKRGYGAACQAGMRALHPDTHIVVFLDGDYSDYPEEIEELIWPITENRADLVIGSRTLLGSSRGVLNWPQLWGNRLATMLIRWRFGCRHTDLGPFRAIRRSALDDLGMKDRGYGWTAEMQVKAVCAGLRITEVPVRYRQRIGRSKISGTLKGGVCAGAKILWTIARYSFAAQPCCRGLSSRTPAES
jgi:glycosyltransferase involved in cell wall biosynthesis